MCVPDTGVKYSKIYQDHKDVYIIISMNSSATIWSYLEHSTVKRMAHDSLVPRSTN